MFFDSRKLLNGRWGIFVNNQPIASIGSEQACGELISLLKSRLEEKPDKLSTDILDTTFEYLRSMSLIL